MIGCMQGEENSKKGWGRGRGKSRSGRGQSHCGGRGLLLPSSPRGIIHHSSEASSSPKHPSKGPRMPDGTRGFTMGRGNPALPPPPPSP